MLLDWVIQIFEVVFEFVFGNYQALVDFLNDPNRPPNMLPVIGHVLSTASAFGDLIDEVLTVCQVFVSLSRRDEETKKQKLIFFS